MQTLGQRLYQLRRDKKLAREMLGTKVGVSKTAIKNWEDDENAPKLEYLRLLADYFDCGIEYLTQGIETENLSSMVTGYQVPILNKVDTLLFDEYLPKELSSNYLPITSDEYNEQLYWLILDDDSMQPTFTANHLVLINPALTPEPGDYVIAVDDAEQVLFRKWRDCGFDEKTGQHYTQLIAYNSDYPTIDSRFASFTIYGVATEHRVKLK